MHDIMSVRIIVDPPKSVRPEGAIRADVAWKLYLPENMGGIPGFGEGRTEPMGNWLWWELSRKLGFLHRSQDEPVYVLTPPLTPEGREFIVRICSMWSDEVYVLNADGREIDIEKAGDNSWIPPVVNVSGKPGNGTALGKLTEENGDELDTFYSPLLGYAKSFVRAYTIPPGETYARFHSHTAREELYLVLQGKGTVRLAGHSVPVSEGDLVAKPTGPDLSSQLLADRGESMRILDIEIWPSRDKIAKDVVHYPDHAELDLFGEGWNFMMPDEALYDFRDAMENYSTGYRRKLDGSWEPRDVPGFRKREK